MEISPADPPTVAIVGAGPAGLAAAEVLAAQGCAVTLFDRMPSPARKFLMAGRGGLNLTHSEPFDAFCTRYAEAEPALAPALSLFPPDALRTWSEALGEPTFIGSSGRVFPRSLKASPLLRAWLARLAAAGVALQVRHRWTGWDRSGALRFDTPAGLRRVAADATLLALGGASWPRLGSDGAWAALLAGDGIAVAPFHPSNCGFAADWSETFRRRFAGAPLKRIALHWGARSVRGEATVTAAGLEGGAVYALSAPLREAIAAQGSAGLHIALRPDLSREAIATRLANGPRKASAATLLRKTLALSPVAVGLVAEARHRAGGAVDLAALVDRLPVTLTAPAPLAQAISTAGGVRWDALDARFMLRARPGTFAAGEMLDWEAPTGGYLLQACFATGRAAAQGMLAYLGRARPSAP